MSTALYRYFDADDRLLYVGVSSDPVKRAKQHRRTSHWWPQVARGTCEWLVDRADALEAEADAIRNENPLHNVSRPGMTREEWIAAQLAKAPAPKQEQIDAIARVLEAAKAKAAS